MIATFIVDASGFLFVADRHSEHVACAGGLSVRSAGEITFSVGPTVEVLEVSNQSTGYCPEPESWPAVADALSRAKFVAPDRFARAYAFRRCDGCDQLTLIKDSIFECGVCGAELSIEYNVQAPQ